METRKPCEKLKLNVTSGWELTAHHRSWKVSHNAFHASQKTISLSTRRPPGLPLLSCTQIKFIILRNDI